MSSLHSSGQSSLSVVQLIKSNDFLAAETQANLALQKDSKNAKLWYLLAVISQSLGKQEECVNAFKRSIEIEPNFSVALFEFAKFYISKNHLNEAITTFKKLLKIEPQHINGLFLIGVQLNKIKNFAEAEYYLSQANALLPSDINIKIALGQAQLHQDKLDEAIAMFDLVLEQDPNNLAALNNKGIGLKKRCNWQDAIDVLEFALTLVPNQLEIIKNLASCYTIVGSFGKSKNLYNKALQIDPLNIDSHHWLNQMLWEVKDPEFLASYRYTLKTHPKANELMLSYAHKLRLSGENDSAKQVLEEAISVESNHIPSLIEMCMTLRELGDFEQSMDFIRKAKKIDHNDITVNEELGKSYLSLGLANESLNVFDNLLLKQPNHQGWWAYKTTALKLLKSEQYNYYCNYDHILVAAIETPTGFNSVKDFNAKLVETLREYHRFKTNPLDQSLLNGSQTLEKLFDYHVPIIKQLVRSFDEQMLPFLANLPKDDNHPVLSRNTGKYKNTDSWSVILHDTGFHKNHFHPAGWYSSSYYAKLPKVMEDSSMKQGWLTFGQPGLNMNTQVEGDLTIQPKEGYMVRFPSYFWHGTKAFNSNEERITVPNDIIPI